MELKSQPFNLFYCSIPADPLRVLSTCGCLDNRIVLEKVVYTAANTICCTYINTSGEVQTQKKIETYLVTRCEKGRPTVISFPGYL